MNDKNKNNFFKLIKHSYFYSISFDIYDKNKSYSIQSIDGKKVIIKNVKYYLYNNDVNDIKIDIFNFLKTNVIYDKNIGKKIKIINDQNNYNINTLFNKIKKDKKNKLINQHYEFIIKKLRSKMLVAGKRRRTVRRKRKTKKTKKTKRKSYNKSDYDKSLQSEIDTMIVIILIFMNLSS